MATPRTVDLLPEIFRTDTNRKFLNATLDQLTQEPNLKRTQGYVGRRVGPGVNPADNYVTEPSAVRTDYQLEPGVVFLKPDTSQPIDAITYPGILDALDLQGANTTRADRLFDSQYYAWDSFCDLDKFSNYSQYYWLSSGPNSVDIFGTAVALTDAWEITREANGYIFSDISGENPDITLVRGGNYEFTVNQPGAGFWIQAAPGISGTLPFAPNISSRGVLGVDNNGTQQGTVRFNVPLKTAQDFYYSLPSIGDVDLVTTLKFNQINNVYVSEFLAQYPDGIDDITDLNGRTVVFLNTTANAESGGWQITTQFDPLPRADIDNGLPGSYDTLTYDQTTDLPVSERYSVWQIQYIDDLDGNPFIRLNSILPVPNLSKFAVLFGTEYASTQWYKNASGFFEEIPLLTAVLDTLWYQDSANPELFGRIKLIDLDQEQFINVNEIVGAKNYTSPNGVVFTNGLKVQFRGLVEPAQFQNLEYYVEGVGTGPGIDARVGFIDGEAYFGPFHIYQSRKMTGPVHKEDQFQQYIYDTVEESVLATGSGAPAGAPLPTTGVFGAMIGNGIKLIPVTDFITPETYTISESVPYDSTSYDSTPYDSNLNAPQIPDYITINRASADRNAWSRSNRWFHIDVLTATAEYNNQILNVNNSLRAKRPVIEFRANINLFNFGTQGKSPVNIVDLENTDAFSNINGTTGYSTDGYTFINGSRVIFAADIDPNVRNQIYEVRFIDPDNSGNFIIDLVPALNGTALINQTVVCLSGVQQQGKSFWFDGVSWLPAQEKTGINQPPLFDVIDANGFSFSNRAVYPSSTFVGSKLFGYAQGTTQIQDTVLGFPLRYLNINNVGDIVFENYLYTDTFIYVENRVSREQNVSTGFVRQYIDRVLFSDLIGWQSSQSRNISRQIFKFEYAELPLTLDIPVDVDAVFAPLQIFAEGKFIDPDTYVYEIVNGTTVITLLEPLPPGTVIEVQAISSVASSVGYYQVPLNLENNPLNENSNVFTLGTIRTHYESIGQNLRNIQGPIIGANNSRDLGNILRYGDIIVQHSSPLALTGVFLRREQFELFSALEFNSREYIKFKALLLDLAVKGNFENLTASEILDIVLQEIALGKSEIFPFYWSDMIPAGETYTENSYTYSFISTPTFDTLQTYNFDSANFKGLLIFLNGELLINGYDYEVSADSPTVTITVPLTIGDVIKIREYPTTYGSFVPNTPTKLGLYPAFKPEIYVDNSYTSARVVIRGHDGSITLAFRDVRDQVLLEFEKRIFDNLKVGTAIPLSTADVVPGQFRTTDYTQAEINDMLSVDFLSWVGWNKLDYTTQEYQASNEFTYNYSQSADVLTNQPSVGAWRGIYNYFYDTYTPNTTPWEMLGLSEKPDWWENQYGPAPYTSGNTVLWDDLAAGLIRDPNGAYVDPLYVRPELLSVIPAGSEGELLNPLECTVGNFDATSFRRSWKFGDNGPVENTWRTSSSWPFSAMRLLALTKPAQFFSLFADRDRYVFDADLDQYLWDGRYRLDAKDLTPLYGNGVSKASYLNWIIDYNRQLGINSTDNLTLSLNNIDVRLCWRTAAFTDKKYLKVYTERSTPDSLNTSLILPDESYQLLLYKNQPFGQIIYSSVIVQRTTDGYAVLGYSSQDPYFEILISRPSSNTVTIAAGNTSIKVSQTYTNNTAQVPYGFVFTNESSVCDFLLSYGKLLEDRGLIFENRENGYTLNWTQMAQEFLYWTQQGWATGSIINLNPAATSISVVRPNAIVDSINTYTPENIILNQNRQPLPTSELVIDRLDNLFKVSTLTSNTINYLQLKFTAYEHLLVLDNRSIFSDLLYDPVTGVRQSRVLISGWLSGDWNGQLNAPGFILNQDNIVEWIPNRKYAKGEIILFKNEYWSASTIIQPSTEFNYSLWIKSDYDQIQKGLLPNASNQSTQLSTAYSTYDANLEQEVDLFSYGLIGFRPREYMQALNLDDVSQVNLYQQFLNTKGTLRSAEIFNLADLGKEAAEYQIYEFWAILRSTYGATANRSYFELLLNQALLPSDPSLIQVVLPGEISEADQTVLLQDVWKSSTNLTSPNILPTTIITPTDIGLPTAGYANLDDVDLTAFDLDAVVALDGALDEIGVGTTIWVASVNQYDWHVYRAELVPGTITRVSDNLEGQSLVQFNKAHGLAINDILVIKFFDDSINGIYRVRAVPSITTLLIDYVFDGLQSSITGEGVGFTLQAARVAQAADIADLPYARQLTPGIKVWVDNNGADHWTVLEKTDPFAQPTVVTPEIPVENSLYGASLAQGFNNLSALVGAPGYNPAAAATVPGAVYTYVKTNADVYAQNSVLELGTTGTSGYGNAMDMGDQQWAVIGASASNTNRGYAVVVYRNPSSSVFQQWQLLSIDAGSSVTAADEFGYSVTISQDERWIYVGAPGGNIVYVYGRVDYQDQFVTYRAANNQNFFNYSDHCVIDLDDQLLVSDGSTILTLGIDYIVAGNNVVFSIPPEANSAVTIARRANQSFTGDASTTVFDLSSIYTAVNSYSASVYINDVLQRPVTDYTISALRVLTFVVAPAAGITINVRSQTYFTPVTSLTVPGVASTERFGHSVSTTTDGRQVIVGCPDISYTDPVTSQVIQQAGATYVFDRSIQNFQVTNSTTVDYTTVQNLVAPTSVILNGAFLLNEQNNIGGTYSVAANTVTVDTDIAVGDVLTIESNQFSLIQTIYSVAPDSASKFGYKLDQCINDCSLYVSAPFADSDYVQSGQVEFNQNQARVYGIITSNIANPTLTTGNTIRINNYFVELTGTTVADLAADINAAGVPNAQASVTADVTLLGDGTTRVFDVGTIWSAAVSYTSRVLINNVVQTDGVNYTYNNTTQQITFSVAPLVSDRIVLVSGRLILSVKNFQSAAVLNKLQVLPGTGTLFANLGWTIYVNLQVITAPIQQNFANFGSGLFISDNTTALLIGAPNGSAITQVTFDDNTTTFDSFSTLFGDTVIQSGVVYLYDFLPAASPSVTNPGQFVFGQQIFDTSITSVDQFGTAIDYTTGTLLVGSPGSDLGDSQSNYGQVVLLKNPEQQPAWKVVRSQQPVVDVSLLNTVFMYDRVSGSQKQYFDYFNPLQGRLLGAVAQNIDYIGAINPAAYNVGEVNNYGNSWRQERVGQIWWDTSNVRFIDTNQDDVVYASRRWGQVFPGSIIQIYQWIASSVAPVDYAGPGLPLNTTSYVASTSLNEQGVFGTQYYFWVTGISTVDRAAKKTLSIETISQYIFSPRSSGISYIAPINASTIAIYNGLPYISAQDTILHVEYDQQYNDAAVHVEYQLIPDGRADGFLTDSLYLKLQDSFCGVDTAGNPVPDPFLSPSEQYGLEARPRQSMFFNRLMALKNYLGRANTVLKQFPISETRRFSLLNSSEPEPSVFSGAWNLRLASYEELTYQNLAEVALGYKYLVASDSNYRGLWTIYEVVPGPLFGSKALSLIRVQNYDTKQFWNYIDWYLPGYNPSTRILVEVPTFSALDAITVPEGSSVKVTANAQGKFEIYQYLNNTWIRVGLEDGTIEFVETLWNYELGRFGFDIEVFDAQFFDQEPVIETRKIIQAINQELFVDDLLIERNRSLTLMFNYVLSEQIAPLWLTKTSLIDVDHTIRDLVPFQIYRRDNQDFVLDYIKEVKPYHVQIREFNLIYKGFDQYLGTINDFDLPAFWDAAQDLFISPILDDSDNVSTTSSFASTDPIWTTFPYNQWYENYLLTLESVTIVDAGEGYTVAPEVVVTGQATREAQMIAKINSAGGIVSIEVIDPGLGYSTTAIIELVGGLPEAQAWVASRPALAGSVIQTPAGLVYRVVTSGVLTAVPPTSTTNPVVSGTAVLTYLGRRARAVAVMGNGLTRSITTTIKYDRYQYQTTIVDWQPEVSYDNGTLVRYDDRVWSADSDDSTAVETNTFDPDQWTLIPAGDLSGVDRTMGYYVPTPSEPGLDLALLISGVDYPGVQVKAPGFNQNTGFDVGNYDINPYDNLSFGPEGLPTYDPAILDAIYASEFTDPYLGIGPTAINIAGGAFVDTYSSHAPEELVPGIVFDTLDMRVFSTVGSDWADDGHGFPLETTRYFYDTDITEYSFADLLNDPVQLRVWNQTAGTQLIPLVNYVIDWVNQTIEIVSGVAETDVIVLAVYGLGGGNQLYNNSYNGLNANAGIILPVPFDIINLVVIFVNETVITNYTYSYASPGFTRVVFASTYTAEDYVFISAMGATGTTPVLSWSTPQTEYFVYTGSLSFPLSQTLTGTNPANVVVEKNGVRARPSEGVEYIDDGSSLEYYLPTRGGYSQALISDNDVTVYVDNTALVLGTEFFVSPWDGSSRRTVILTDAPPLGSRILISVRTEAQYYISSNNILIWNSTGSLVPSIGDVISITSWNDTSQQNLLTQVFVGPTTEGAIQTNRFDTGRIITNPSRLQVTLDGLFLFEGSGFTIDGSVVELVGAPISATQVVAITSVTESVIPGAIAFRIFQDMRGLQSLYRITENTTTTLVQPLSADDTVIYVDDASRLSVPNLPQGIFGLITINGERIAYRTRDVVTNTISGLRRGTAGTGAANHAVNTPVYDIGRGNLLPAEYQNYVTAESFLATGTQTVFATENISVVGVDSTEIDDAIEVYVGGIRQTGGYIIVDAEPVVVQFTVAPTANYQVTILVRRGTDLYAAQGDGIPLQEQQTLAARFIRGE